MKQVKIKKNNLIIKEKILGFIDGEIKSHGTSGRVSCPKKFIGKKAFVIIIDDEKQK